LGSQGAATKTSLGSWGAGVKGSWGDGEKGRGGAEMKIINRGFVK
jgi:hypothetical protein